MSLLECKQKARSEKGRSLLAFENTYISIDIETTGLDPYFDKIIEIAGIRICDGAEVSRFESLVNPECEISSYITELTGITNDMVATAPTICSVLPFFLDFILDSLLLGHNVNFDINFLYDNALLLGLPPLCNDFIDTVRLSRRLFPDFPNHKLRTLVRQFGISPSTDHRALSDASNTMKCYEHMKQYVSKNHLDISVSSCKNLQTVNVSPKVFDADHPLYGKICVFTGVLEEMSRTRAMQYVADCGGICLSHISQSVNYLILGNNDYCARIKGGKSNKQKQAEALKLKGFDIEILSECIFYEMISVPQK